MSEGLGGGQQTELGCVGAPAEHETGLPVGDGQVGVVVCGVPSILECLHPLVEGITDAGGPEILEQEGDASERTFGQLSAGGLSRLVERRVDHRVHVRVQPFDPLDGGVHQLERGRLSCAHQLGEGHRIEPGEIIGHQVTIRRPRAASPVGAEESRGGRRTQL